MLHKAQRWTPVAHLKTDSFHSGVDEVAITPAWCAVGRGRCGHRWLLQSAKACAADAELCTTQLHLEALKALEAAAAHLRST